MKIVLKYIAVVVFGFLWFLGCSKSTVTALVDNGYLLDDFRYGDLYRLSNLRDFREEVKKCKNPYHDKKSDIALYLFGDSFIDGGRLSTTDLATATVIGGHVTQDVKVESIHPQSVLIIETVERHLRERFSENPWSQLAIGTTRKLNSETIDKGFFSKILDFEVPYNEDMHEMVLFSSDFFLRIKEWKAWLNHRVFGRIEPDVALLKGELVYHSDVDPGVSSVYDYVSETELDSIVNHINLTRENYLKAGFKEVYISIIPNKSSRLVRHEKSYNRLVERVEEHPMLAVPIISVWNEFSQKNYYMRGDSHWNCEGMQIWVDKVNEQVIVNK